MLDGDVEFIGFIPLRECAQLNKTNEFPIIIWRYSGTGTKKTKINIFTEGEIIALNTIIMENKVWNISKILSIIKLTLQKRINCYCFIIIDFNKKKYKS